MRIPEGSLAGRVALVTGAATGIGRSVAKLLAHAGARVALFDRKAAELTRTVEEINGPAGVTGPAMAWRGDVTQLTSLEQAVAAIEDRWGRLDIVVANAGVNGVWAGIDSLTEAEFGRTVDINLTGSFRTAKAAVPLLRRSGGGSIIFTASVNGTRMFSNAGATAYAASKAGQLAIARLLAVELAPDGIRVNTVCPGAVHSRLEEETERRETERLGRPVVFPEGAVPLTGKEPGTAGQVAQAVWFLASDASSHTTGTELFVDGAQSLFQG